MKYFFMIWVALASLTCVSVCHANSGSKCPPDSVCLENPLGEIDTIPKLIGVVIGGVLGIVGSLALLVFIYGGLLYMTAGGNEEQVAKGKNTLIWAAFGLIVIFSSYAIIRFLFADVIGAPGL